VLGEAARRAGLLANGAGAPPELAAGDLAALFRARFSGTGPTAGR
jgi:hypothetical protein